MERISKRAGWREETDLCVRLRLRGYRIFYTSAAEVGHRGARSGESPRTRQS